MTNRENPENQESNRCELVYVLCILILLPINTELAKSRREYIRNCEAAVILPGAFA